MSPQESCPFCGAELKTPLVCEACGALLAPGKMPPPFAVFGLEPHFDLDPKALRKRLLQLSRAMHPDFFSTTDDDTQARAERNSAELNAAHEQIVDAFRRADWLVGYLDGPSQTDERQMPSAFLMEVMEWNEAIEETRANPASLGALDQLETGLRSAREETMQRVADTLTPLPPRGSDILLETRRSLNAVRYLDRTLHEIAELRLERAQS